MRYREYLALRLTKVRTKRNKSIRMGVKMINVIGGPTVVVLQGKNYSDYFTV